VGELFLNMSMEKKVILLAGDYEEVDKEHWFTARQDSQLILMR
jgi:hypothetical protein